MKTVNLVVETISGVGKLLPGMKEAGPALALKTGAWGAREFLDPRIISSIVSVAALVGVMAVGVREIFTGKLTKSFSNSA
jgi:hypothetical protein